MSSIVVQAFITLDGVVQGGGGPDEDPSGGFEYGGWSMGYDRQHDPDNEAGRLIEEWESRTEALLLGRATYDIFAGSWGVWADDAPGFEGDLTRRYNRIPKYVASRTRTELRWRNSHLLGGDLPEAVRRLRADVDASPDAQPGGEIRVWGSTRLVHTLAERHLIDEYRLIVYPLVLGSGKRLFGEGFPYTALQLVDSRPVSSGLVVNTLRPSH